MKPKIKLADFYHIIEERQQGNKLEVTGILNPQDMSSDGMQKNAIVATFDQQDGPKGSWETRNWHKRQQGMER
jgi:hypothetical protein